jgi:predicted Zn-dependent protease
MKRLQILQKGDFKSAINCYTKGIQCDPSNPVLPANRAMALLKTGQAAAAEADCTLAIRYAESKSQNSFPNSAV